jgi:hypothetical protein
MNKPIFNKTQKDLAAKWGTTQMTISNFAKAGCDFNAPDQEVAKWLITHSKRKSKAMREAINAVLKPEAVKMVESEKIRSLEEMRDYYSMQLDAASKAEHLDREEVKFWNDLLLKADESLRRSEAHSKRLGLDSGEILSRGEVERILRAMFWGGNACCDKFSKQIAQRLSNKPPAEVHKILKPTMTALTMFEPLTRLSKVPGDINLPQWVVECARTEEKLYLKPRND